MRVPKKVQGKMDEGTSCAGGERRKGDEEKRRPRTGPQVKSSRATNNGVAAPMI
jgi:hypothetical protein